MLFLHNTLKKEKEIVGGYFVSKQILGFQKTVIRITVNIHISNANIRNISNKKKKRKK